MQISDIGIYMHFVRPLLNRDSPVKDACFMAEISGTQDS